LNGVQVAKNSDWNGTNISASCRKNSTYPTSEHGNLFSLAWASLTRASAQISRSNWIPFFPDVDPQVNRELVSLLVYLGSESNVAKSVVLLDNAKDIQVTVTSDAVLGRNAGYAFAVASMHDSQPNLQAIAYAYALREARAGWTPELRKTYFTWFPSTF
jgi:hypothetical protein